MRIVIIGAGPAGLYTAIKMKQAGIQDITVYDPREGQYTRPGHLNLNVFLNASTGLNFNFRPKGRIGHIKDLERQLYKKAKDSHVTFSKKAFVRMHQDPYKPGIVIADEQGIEEIVKTDYVFDCTGGKREVINVVNQIDPHSTLQRSTFTDLPVQNHFLAYIKISHQDFMRFEREEDKDISKLDSLTFARTIIKLRSLGWNEFVLPRCYGMSFGKDKVCMYMHAPDHLSKDQYDDWVQTVLNCYANSISYSHLPASPKNKPRFVSFTTNAQVLQEISYKGKNLPTVIALGDSQIDFDYAEAHGIKDGITRINAFFEHSEIFDNKIYYFDAKEYQALVKPLLDEHKQQVINAAEQIKKSFLTSLETASTRFEEALNRSADPVEQELINDILNEIKIRQKYIKTLKLFSEWHDTSNQLVFKNNDYLLTTKNLHQLKLDLLDVRSQLPLFFSKEHAKIDELFIHVAISSKTMGSNCCKKGDFFTAIHAYTDALDIYNQYIIQNQYALEKTRLYSNLAIAYLKTQQYLAAIGAAKEALLNAPVNDTDESKALKEKSSCNLIKALCAQAEADIHLDLQSVGKYLHYALMILDEYREILSPAIKNMLKKRIDEVQAQVSTEDLNPQETSGTSENIPNYSRFFTPKRTAEEMLEIPKKIIGEMALSKG